jgi:SAM-dependent methyltransferase
MSANYPRELGVAFADEDVVRNYRHRPPYPKEVFGLLEQLLVAPRVVLDAGCGTGALTRGLAAFAERVDALDPSEAMLTEARRSGSPDPKIRWIVGRAEEAPLSPPYGLITTGASVHWMDPAVVMPRFRAALAPGAHLAIADMEWVHPKEPWREEFVALIQSYSPIKHHDDFAALIRSLEEAGHFRKTGERRTQAMPFTTSTEDYLALLASTSSLSRATLGPRHTGFESDARAIWKRHDIARVRMDVVGVVAWGQPR